MIYLFFSEDYDFDRPELWSSLHGEDEVYLEDLHHMDNCHYTGLQTRLLEEVQIENNECVSAL
jgi:hypothetical protein